jgi:hypothetical protein
MEKLKTVLLIDDSNAGNAMNTSMIQQMGFAKKLKLEVLLLML